MRGILFVDLLLVASIFGLAFAHVLELPGKLQLDGPVWLSVQQHLFIGFGPFAAFAEPASIVLAWMLVTLTWRSRMRSASMLIAAAATTVGLIEWSLVVAPMNTLLNGWSAATLPSDWTACRDRWETGHAIHAALFGIALCALAYQALTLPRKPEP